MASLTFLTYFALAVLATNVANGQFSFPTLPPVNRTEWWGPGTGAGGDDRTIYNSSIQFTDAMITDLKFRLQNHQQFKPPLQGVAFNYGFNSTYLNYWIQYLSQQYPFADRQAYLNQYPLYVTQIQGLKIQFLRVRTQNTTLNYVPLLILHGWPGSMREFYETIPYLLSYSKAQGFALDIIIPSLPGFGFSSAAVRPGLGVDKMAVVCSNLMRRLGYPRYVVQGGDLGAMIASVMGTFFPFEVKGLHLNYLLIHTPSIIFKLLMGNYHKDEIAPAALQPRLYPSLDKMSDIMTFTGFLHYQATRPDTLGFGLNDSPAGLIAYTLDKVSGYWRKSFINATDGGLTQILSPVQLMDNFMLYWASGCITTSMRLHSETFNKRFVALRLNEIPAWVPTWVLQAPDEIVYVPQQLTREKFPLLMGETLPSEGGHFYAWEKPDLFAQDVVNSIITFRQWHWLNTTNYDTCSSAYGDSFSYLQ